MNKTYDWIYYVIFIILGIVIYAQTFSFEFNIDDYLVCENLEMVEKGISGIPEILTTNYEIKEDGSAFLFRPLARITFALENQFLLSVPRLSHILNLVLYLITCFLLFNILKKLIDPKYNVYIFLGVLIFLVHPLHTEVVCSLKNREEILSLLFSLLTIKVVLKFLANHNYLYIFASFFLFLLAVLSKISAIPFVLFIFLVCIYTTKKWFDYKYIPIGISLILPIILYFTYMAYALPGQGRMPKISTDGITFQQTQVYSYPENPLDSDAISTLSKQFGTAGEVLALYSSKIIFPVKLIAYYGYNVVPVSTITKPTALLSLLFHLILFGFGLFLFIRRNLIGLGIVFFLGCLFPYLNIIAPTPGIFAERLCYFPSIGYSIFIIGILIYFHKRHPRLDRILIILAISYITLLSFKSYDRSGDWVDSLTLLETDVENEKNSLILKVLLFKDHEKKYKESTDPKIADYHLTRSMEVANEMLEVNELFYFPHFYLAEIHKHLKIDMEKHNYHKQMVKAHIDNPLNLDFKIFLNKENVSLDRLLN